MDNIQPISKPRVSVIIPAYNTAPLIGSCLDSVFSQTYLDFEVLVVNDGSSDTKQLEQVLQKYASRLVYIKQENKRAAGARNTAIREARGEFVAFLDSDDIWFPDHLASQMAFLDQNPSFDMVYSDSLLGVDAGSHTRFMERCPSHGPVTFAALVVERCQVSISTVVVRKTAIVKAGLFDESLARCDDYDMWLRAAWHGARIGYTHRVQARLNEGRPGSLGQSRLKMAQAYWQILEKTGAFPLSASDREVVQQRIREIRARCLFEEGKSELLARRFERARTLFFEANQHWRAPKLTLALFGLKVAPAMASRLITFRSRIQRGVA